MKRLLWFVVVLCLIAAAFVAGTRMATREAVFAASTDGAHVAWASDRRCLGGPCQTLWIGTSRSDGNKVATLDPEGDIEDPIGGDVALYQSLAGQLQTLIEKRLEEITR